MVLTTNCVPQRKPNWQGLLVDGLHFKPDGQQAVLKLLTKAINENLPHLRHGPQLQTQPPMQMCVTL